MTGLKINAWDTLKKYFYKYLIIISFCYSFETKAQILFALPSKQKAFSYSNGVFGKNLFFTTSISRGFHVNLFNLIKDDVTLFVDLSNKSNFFNKNEFRFVYGGQGYLFPNKKIKILFRKTFTVSRINTDPANATYLGAELELMPGVYKEKYFVALDLYYGDSFKGYVAQRNDNHFHDFLKNIGTGWIKPHRSTFRTGINLGYFITPKLCLYGYASFFVIKPKVDIYTIGLFQSAIGINLLFGKKAPEKTKSASEDSQ